MNIQIIADARIARGNYIRLVVDDKSDMADKAFVEDGIDRFSVKVSALGQPSELGTSGLFDIKSHFIAMEK